MNRELPFTDDEFDVSVLSIEQLATLQVVARWVNRRIEDFASRETDFLSKGVQISIDIGSYDESEYINLIVPNEYFFSEKCPAGFKDEAIARYRKRLSDEHCAKMAKDAANRLAIQEKCDKLTYERLKVKFEGI